MYKYSKRSAERLATCHPDIQKVMNEVIKFYDCTIIEGIRTKETQEEYVRTGKSKTMNSRHLKQNDGYSHAIDVIAYPIKWNDNPRNYLFAGVVIGISKMLGVDLRAGADWDGDGETSDQTFNDIVHFELVKK